MAKPVFVFGSRDSLERLAWDFWGPGSPSHLVLIGLAGWLRFPLIDPKAAANGWTPAMRPTSEESPHELAITCNLSSRTALLRADPIPLPCWRLT